MNDTLKVAGRIGAELGAAKAENEAMRILLRESYSELLVMKTEVGFRGKTLDLIDRIDTFLSQQAEPVRSPGTEDAASMDSNSVQEQFTAVDMATAAAQGFRDGQAAVEQDTAQDEREAFEAWADQQWPGAKRQQLERDEYGQYKNAIYRDFWTGWQARATRPAQTEQQRPTAYPHEAMDKLAADRYRVGAAGAGTLHGFAVRAGDGEQELYRGSKSDCEHVARKLAGAFLDGGFTAFERYAAPIAQTAPQHSDDAAVDRFAAAMKAKLAVARAKGRGGWDDPNVCSVEFLAQLLVEHLGKGNTGTFEDVANFAMMMHQRGADPKVLAEAAPQPEQGGLIKALEEIAAGEKTVWRDDHFEVENDMAIDYPGIAKAALDTYRAALSAQGAAKFRMGDLVKKSTGSEWEGRVVGWYSTEQTAEGYAVESSAHRNSVQIYPAKALEAVDD